MRLSIPVGLWALLPLLAAPSCGAAEGDSETAGTDSAAGEAVEVECICGTTRGDLVGCEHEACAAGRTNPENPDCVCGTLTAGEDQ